MPAPTLTHSFGYAIRGVMRLVRSQRNARIHLAATVAVCVLGWRLDVGMGDWRWLAAAITLVWTAEAVNTAIEAVCDVVSPGLHPAVAQAKDVAAGAVLLAAMGAAAIGLMTFLPYLLH